MHPHLLEYVVIGDGPAALCAIAKIYGAKIPKQQILWVGPHFKGGDFCTKLSVGSSVPGNTSVESYHAVNEAIYQLIPSCSPNQKEKMQFKLNSLPPAHTCCLKTAAAPLQHISDNLRKLVPSMQGMALAIRETKKGIEVDIHSNNTVQCVTTKRVILAIGAEPRTLSLPTQLTIIDPNITFIESELKQYVQKNPSIDTVAVIGSSHSAALAVMHLLQADIKVIQFMNKAYKFATPLVAADGTRYTQFDNTGLKGEVAAFTRKLLNGEISSGKWECHIEEKVEKLMNIHLPRCTHAVTCIGYVPNCSLTINGLPLSAFTHNKQTTQLINSQAQSMPGIFGIGIAFPLEVQSLSGEIESAVGIKKFWTSINDRILVKWKNSPST